MSIARSRLADSRFDGTRRAQSRAHLQRTTNHEFRSMPTDPKKPTQRDDAEAQPESGYPNGRLSTKPSVPERESQARHDDQKGSESEFDSEKPNS